LLLGSLPRCDLARCAICAEEIPGVEAGEVLNCSQDLVAAGNRGGELKVVGHGGVVDKSVGDHFGGKACSLGFDCTIGLRNRSWDGEF
jgi:hypothetical protein